MVVAVTQSAAVGVLFWKSKIRKWFFGTMLFLYWGLRTCEVVFVVAMAKWVRFELSGSANFGLIWSGLEKSVVVAVMVFVRQLAAVGAPFWRSMVLC